MNIFVVSFEKFAPYLTPHTLEANRQFHICRLVREEASLPIPLFSLTGNVIFADFRQVRDLTVRLNATHPEWAVRAGDLNAMGLIDEILHFLVVLYRQQVRPDLFETAIHRLNAQFGLTRTTELLVRFTTQFPPQTVYAGTLSADDYLNGTTGMETHRALSVEEILLLALANLNPAFKPFLFLFDDTELEHKTIYEQAVIELQEHLRSLPGFGPGKSSLWDMLRAPALAAPDSLAGQLDFMRKNWGLLLKKFTARLLTGLDVIVEENKPVFFGPGPTQIYTYTGFDEYEHFSPDQDWMPKTVLIAKSTLVWLYQLSQKYERPIKTLDQIPDEELDILATRGFTGLWLIGLWERSPASKTIKQWTGNPEAAASAYSLYDYTIAQELGGWEALTQLRERCAKRGIRLGSDMVPNHTGIDSRWIIEHPERFLQLPYSPYPGYQFDCGNLSGRDDITIQIESHYFTRSDAAVVFRRIDNKTGETRYIYHGNDGTAMPWNDTAQIDFLNPDAREAVIRTIVSVCQQFPIVRFDAAMTLAKRHIQRLWYPEPGQGGAIASRAERAISAEEFNQRIPIEFWREVVDRCAAEAPGTLLLAEAFWMMEGYFVRTLGMHRVYNSAFMNMLKNEENAKYRATIKNTLEFDPEILKRFVNFMNNPDEESAIVQFGSGDKYFGICTLLVTMPGLPMFGHGQIEGFSEKYGMEYRRSYRDETADQELIRRHEREIFPLMKRRAIFSGSHHFCLYDFFTVEGAVNENVFAYSNRFEQDRALVLYNNSYSQTSGWIHHGAVDIPQKGGGTTKDDLYTALHLHNDNQYFITFREQKSGLWYIRSSQEIASRGLFVALAGYEAQVFLDINEQSDTNDRRWSLLHSRLGGRGVSDLEAAIQDIFMAELYEPFMTILFEEKNASLGFSHNFKQAVRDFIAAALKIAPFTDKAVDILLEEFNAYVCRINKLTEFAGYFAGCNDKVPPRVRKMIGLFLEHNYAAIEHSRAYLVGYGLLSLLRFLSKNGTGDEAATLARQWHLDRKLCEAYRALGLSEDEAPFVVELILAVLSRTSPEKPFPLNAASILIENYHTKDFRRLLGVNRFNDITWFNQESFEKALLYAPLFLILENDAAFQAPNTHKVSKASSSIRKRRLETIAGIVATLKGGEKQSDYRLDYLIEIVELAVSLKTTLPQM
ncbi:MAG: alpha-amylase [Spirochaetaceae bacterium]|jgi:glycosidase|nr:alpha-amylase [Spirochaetaceae bacterium]